MQDRRKGDRRKLFGKPFLAMLIGGLPEDRRKADRRATAEHGDTPTGSVATVRGELSAGGTVETTR